MQLKQTGMEGAEIQICEFIVIRVDKKADKVDYRYTGTGTGSDDNRAHGLLKS